MGRPRTASNILDVRGAFAKNPDEGTLLADDAFVTITTLDAPAGPKTLTVSE